MPRKPKPARLEERFEFLGDAVAAGDATTLRAALYEVEEIASGRELTLKLWRRTGGQADQDLRELWRHEMRQISRLMAHAGAADVIVNVLGLVEDPEFFGLILDRIGRRFSTSGRRFRRAIGCASWMRPVRGRCSGATSPASWPRSA